MNSRIDTNQTEIPAWVNGTLVPMDKLAVHQQGLKHMAISVFVLCGDKILLQQRAAAKYHTPNLWANTCCTHPHWGEASLDCANRRLQEELGIAGLDLIHRQQVEYRADVGGDMIEHELVEIYTAIAPETLDISLNQDEVQAVRWVSVSELEQQIEETPDAFTPWLKIYLDQHKSAIFGETPA
ncbi:isopentenyl-diphosphate delta-isomerase [Pseudoprimorskyibacter insulae]|uniref:Isopentenyl-diphosphate Delta-isomerase n=1 Tax=Pseudoprimorskyibacter insulae TaxID=1695997 RepID=A0A2R8ATS1_9RHOB|nr:isopentenyl-diphosphate delta-isomerase [Pseudoprimorskyibacter insulae]SPF79435.1 Isopentenyl-diphosphate Delta-isomerase [Pseudoprimorskyibacter insulae]